MSKSRLEAFSDAVIAILITIMVLNLHTPRGTTWHALREELPVLLAYVVSFVYLGIYWNNHHHMLQAVTHVSGAALWANLNLLFWISPRLVDTSEPPSPRRGRRLSARGCDRQGR